MMFTKLLKGLILLASLTAQSAADPSLTEPAKEHLTAAQIQSLGEEFAITQPIRSEQPTESSPTVDIEDDTPVVLESMELRPDEVSKRSWIAPQYEGQENILGWSADVFKTPEGLEDQVKFWVDVYTKYTTDQGVLHDSRYINIVYADIDFTKIENYGKLTSGQRHKAREKLVKEKKKDITSRLKALEGRANAEGLDGEDLRLWNLFAQVDEPKKFSEASAKGRLRFQLGQKDRFIQGIYYSGRYLQRMEQIFREAGLPIELTRLPFVESSFNLRARSKVGASGIWQFMRYTGRLYMKVNSTIDERNDPIIATHAAARLLKFNYTLLNSWPLAVTAYNFGPTGMKREKDKLQTDNLAEIIRRSNNRRLGFASGNFYASFLAALEVEKNAEKYFGKVDWSGELQFDEVILPKSIRYSVLLEHFGGDADRAELYNPHLSRLTKKSYIAIPASTKLRVPKETSTRFLASIESKSQSPSDRKTDQKATEALRTGLTEYQVAMGDTISSIAKEFGVRASDIIEVNGIRNPRSLKVGQTLTIPVVGQ